MISDVPRLFLVWKIKQVANGLDISTTPSYLSWNKNKPCSGLAWQWGHPGAAMDHRWVPLPVWQRNVMSPAYLIIELAPRSLCTAHNNHLINTPLHVQQQIQNQASVAGDAWCQWQIYPAELLVSSLSLWMERPLIGRYKLYVWWSQQESARLCWRSARSQRAVTMEWNGIQWYHTTWWLLLQWCVY